MPLIKRTVNNYFSINGFHTAFHFSWDDQYQFPGENHDFWEIVFVSSGAVEVTEDENVYTLEQNDMILHAPMEFHRIKSKSGSSPTGLICSFAADGELPDELKNGVFTLTEVLKASYVSLFDKIYRFHKGVEEDKYAGQAAAAALTAFLIQLSCFQTSQTVKRSASAILYQKIVSSMAHRVCQNFSLEDFSKENNISISYLKLLFAKYAGISPKLYYTRLRVRHATELLREGAGVAEVAEQMAFSSPNYFSSFYKKNTGLLPSEIRKK